MTGSGLLAGRPVAVVVNEFRFLAGSIGQAAARRIVAAVRRATAEGRIAEFARMGWDPAVVPDPQDPETFRRSKLDWGEPYPATDEANRHTRMLRWYRSLIALRRARPEFTDPRMTLTRVEVDEDARTVLVHRAPLVIAVNLGPAGAATSGLAELARWLCPAAKRRRQPCAAISSTAGQAAWQAASARQFAASSDIQ